MFDSQRTVLEAWVSGINSGRFKQVQDLYHSDAVLLPTFSSRTIRSRDSMTQYFERLGSRKGLRVELHDRTVHSQEFGGRIGCLCGIYRWHFEIDGELLSFEARFTFTTNISIATPILHHHSSHVPRDLS